MSLEKSSVVFVLTGVVAYGSSCLFPLLFRTRCKAKAEMASALAGYWSGEGKKR